MRPCTKCQRTHKDGFSFCPYCGTPVAAASTNESQVPASPSPQGGTIDNHQEHTRPSSRKPIEVRYSALSVALGVGALVIIVALTLERPDNRGAQSKNSTASTSKKNVTTRPRPLDRPQPESPPEQKAVPRDKDVAPSELEQVLYFMRDALATNETCQAAVETVQEAAQQGNFVAMFDTSRAAIAPCRSAQAAFGKLKIRLSATASWKANKQLSQACQEFATSCKIRADAFTHIARERSVVSIRVATPLIRSADEHLFKAAAHLTDAKAAAGWAP